MATKPLPSSIKSCKELLIDLKTTTSNLDNKIKIIHNDEILRRLISARKSVMEAVVQINIAESQIQAHKGK